VELAICLPILVTLVLGSIEATNAIYLKERLTSAAYEGARSATTPGRTAAAATATVNNVLAQFGISDATVTITPTVSVSTTTGTQVTVSVSAPFSSNSCMPPLIVGNVMNDMTATVIMVHQ
jgi:Flp pilus assembly protein TadG